MGRHLLCEPEGLEPTAIEGAGRGAGRRHAHRRLQLRRERRVMNESAQATATAEVEMHQPVAETRAAGALGGVRLRRVWRFPDRPPIKIKILAFPIQAPATRSGYLRAPLAGPMEHLMRPQAYSIYGDTVVWYCMFEPLVRLSPSASLPPTHLADGGRGRELRGRDHPAVGRRQLRRPAGVRSHSRFRNRGTEYLSESGLKRMSGGTKRQCDQPGCAQGGG